MSSRTRMLAGWLLAASLSAAAGAFAGSGISGAKQMFNETTYQELQPYAASDRLIAVLRCEALEIVSPGSRSERQQIRATLLAGPPEMAAGSSLLLARYAQGKPLMEVGKTYLVAAYRESASGPWALLEHRAVDAAAASREFEAARTDVSRRLDAGKPR